MSKQTEATPMQIQLMKLMHLVARDTNMEEPDIVLVAIHLESDEKIMRFVDWIASKVTNEKLTLDKKVVMRAAVMIGRGETDLP